MTSEMIDEFVTAYHEAGHVLLAEMIGARVLTVTIVPNDDHGPRRHGETKVVWRTGTLGNPQLALAQAKVALAGPVAEMIYCDEQYELEVIQEWWADWLMAAASIRKLRSFVTDDAVLIFLATLAQDLIHWMSRDDVWDRVARLADELAAHETLEDEKLNELRELRILG